MNGFGFAETQSYYGPDGEPKTCEQLVQERGGWSNISAYDAWQLSMAGCTQGFQEYPENPQGSVSTEYEYGGGGGTIQVRPEPMEQLEPQPVAWKGAEDVRLADFFTGTDIDTNPVEFTGFSVQGGIQLPAPLPGMGGDMSRELEQYLQERVGITAGITVQDPRIRGVCKPSRRRFKVVADPTTGQPTVISVCPPRRMNPCNPRALGRAARRLGMFQKMSRGIEQIINRQLKRRAPARSFSCAPKKRCR